MVSPLPGVLVDLGSGSTLGFDEHSLQGKITPVVGREMGRKLDSMYNGGQVSFNGTDLRIMLGVMERNNLSDVVMPRVAKQLLECTSLSVSINSSNGSGEYLGMDVGRKENLRARLSAGSQPPAQAIPRAWPPYSPAEICPQAGSPPADRSDLGPAVVTVVDLFLLGSARVTEWLRLGGETQ